MIRKLTLTLFCNLLIINNIYAYDSENLCEVSLAKGDLKEAIKEAKNILKDDPFASNFCSAKVFFKQGQTDAAVNSFEEAEKSANHPADQMLSIIFKGLVYKENNELDQALSIFNTGYETAKLGNTKFVQFERRFLIQMGYVQELQNKHELAYESFAKSLKASSNDDERAESYDRLARSAANQEFFDRAREYSLKGSIMYKKAGYLGEFAELTLLKGQYEILDDDYDMGIKTLKDLAQLCIDAGGDYYLAKTYVELYKLSKEGNKEYLKLAKDVANRIGANDLLKGI